MSHILKSIFLAAFLLLPLLASSRAPTTQDANACSVVQQALVASREIKAGATRADVERHFVRDGGVQFRQTTRYVYRQCPYLRLDVDFDVTRGAAASFSPEDKVVKVSKLYVDYSTKD